MSSSQVVFASPADAYLEYGKLRGGINEGVESVYNLLVDAVKEVESDSADFSSLFQSGTTIIDKCDSIKKALVELNRCVDKLQEVANHSLGISLASIRRKVVDINSLIALSEGKDEQLKDFEDLVLPALSRVEVREAIEDDKQRKKEAKRLFGAV